MINTELVLILVGLSIIACLYSSVGHGGASGYLAILSLTSYGMGGSSWLKQHVWFLNLVVAGLAFYHYYRAGYHSKKLSLPFIFGSIPFAFIGGYLVIDGKIYDTLLSIVLIFAAYKLFVIKEHEEEVELKPPKMIIALPIGSGVGLISGIVGVGGGIFLSPLILLKRWASPKTVAATSALFIWLNSLAGIIGHGVSGQLELDLGILGLFAFSVLVGGFWGAKYGASIAKQNHIRKLLVVVLVIAAMKRVFEIL